MTKGIGLVEVTPSVSATDYSEALARGMAILEALSELPRGGTQSELARTIGVSRATARRALNTLVDLGYVILLDGRNYKLGPKMLGLTSGFLRSTGVADIAQPHLDSLGNQFPATCALAILDVDTVVFVARNLPRPNFIEGAWPGFRLPARTSALGRVIIATRPDLPPELRLPAAEEDVIRQRGYDYVLGAMAFDFHSVAVPIRDRGGHTVAAIHIGTQVDRMSREHLLSDGLTALLAAAGAIESALI